MTRKLGTISFIQSRLVRRGVSHLYKLSQESYLFNVRLKKIYLDMWTVGNWFVIYALSSLLFKRWYTKLNLLTSQFDLFLYLSQHNYHNSVVNHHNYARFDRHNIAYWKNWNFDIHAIYSTLINKFLYTIHAQVVARVC